MNRIELIDTCIDNAKKGLSRLTEDVLSIGGYTSPAIRHLLNNLGAFATNVLEVGTHRGATFFSTLCNNTRIEQKYCCDNFSELDDGTVKSELLERIGNFNTKVDNGHLITFLEGDCFTIDTEKLAKIDLYIFDGAHDLLSQEKAITHFWPALADTAIIVIDDYDWPDVHNGTYAGFKKVGQNNITFNHWWLKGEQGFWNGIGIFLIKK